MGITRVLRDQPPSSKLLTIESFSIVKSRHEGYESAIFGAFGYTWRLVMYPIGKQDDGGSNHISLYLRIEETNSLSKNWEVNVDLKLFVHNQKLNKYLTVQDETVKCFNEAKKEWGFAQLIALSTFNDPNEGYIVQDTCTFGAEIYVVEAVKLKEKVTFISNPTNNKFTWKILHFSSLTENKAYYSDDFCVGERYWRLGFNPKGAGDNLPLFLYAFGFPPKASVSTTWGAVYFRLVNQRSSNHIKLYSAAWYPVYEGYGVGYYSIISYNDLFDEAKGYMVNDCIIIEAEMSMISETKIVSS